MNSEKQRDKQIVKLMIELYCKHKLETDQVPKKYLQLINYASFKIDHCSWGNNKPACKDCPHHCYAPEKRNEIREIMRWTGPRMIIWCPRAAIGHLLHLCHDRVSKRFSSHKISPLI
ncbi:MAG: nitrous oxide-stimulated promoter family protein [Prevotella sp.]|jgi:hypothetical protein|nr:nitrous oxide-stimulated promoter family protein [Prevotella sp.]MCH3995983.1 nitrous oxide-stimulated promoter family protein [Prevotella sp.]